MPTAHTRTTGPCLQNPDPPSCTRRNNSEKVHVDESRAGQGPRCLRVRGERGVRREPGTGTPSRIQTPPGNLAARTCRLPLNTSPDPLADEPGGLWWGSKFCDLVLFLNCGLSAGKTGKRECCFSRSGAAGQLWVSPVSSDLRALETGVQAGSRTRARLGAQASHAACALRGLCVLFLCLPGFR